MTSDTTAPRRAGRFSGPRCEAADPADAVARHLRRAAIVSRFRNIYVVGAGKAGASMARAAERVLGRRITAGLINVKDGHVAKPAAHRTERVRPSRSR